MTGWTLYFSRLDRYRLLLRYRHRYADFEWEVLHIMRWRGNHWMAIHTIERQIPKQATPRQEPEEESCPEECRPRTYPALIASEYS
jgi:hypothetical protein